VSNYYVALGDVVWVRCRLILYNAQANNSLLEVWKDYAGIFKGVVVGGSQGVIYIGFRHLQQQGLPDWKNIFETDYRNVFPLSVNKDILAHELGGFNSAEEYLSGGFLRKILGIGNPYTDSNSSVGSLCRTYDFWLVNTLPEPIAVHGHGKIYHPARGAEYMKIFDWSEIVTKDQWKKIDGYFYDLSRNSARLFN